MKIPYFATLFLGLALSLQSLPAQVPQLVNYQGRVQVGTTNFDGSGQFKFALVSSDGSNTFWSNDGTSASGSEPTNPVTLTVVKGLYSVLLGDTTIAQMTGIPSVVFTNPDVRLRVWFSDGVNGSQLLTPDQRLAPSVYISDGAVTTSAIAPNAVTGANIAAGTINGTNVASGSLDFSRLAVASPPAAGQVLSFDGTTLNWTAPGSGGGVWALNGTSAYYNGGKVGIGTSAPANKFSVYTPNQPAFGSTIGLQHFSQSVSLVTTVNELYGAGFGTTSAHSLGLFTNNGASALTINTGGQVVMTGGTTGGSVTVGTPNAELGMTFFAQGLSNRADFRYDGTTIKLVAGSGTGIPASTAGLAVNISGNVGIGTVSPVAKLDVNGTTRTKVLTITGGADLAEPFQVDDDQIEKGSVVVIDENHPGSLKRSHTAYDKRVAGIVSGANGIHPGIALQQEGVIGSGQDVALTGRVYVLADATSGPIQAGDLLTSSATPGHAMRARDPRRSQGAVLGKAMTALPAGKGYVLVLVTLQ
ncbi:MAG: hypothetical protein ACR2NX_03390 [Chthoniobacterales bacterium]